MLITIERNRKSKITITETASTDPDYSDLAAAIADRMIAEEEKHEASEHSPTIRTGH